MKKTLMLYLVTMLFGCSYIQKPYKCYHVNEAHRNSLDSDYVCITNEDAMSLAATTYKIDDTFIVHLNDKKNKDMCKLEEKTEDSNEYFMWGKKRIDLDKETVYSCSSGIIDTYIQKKDKEVAELAKQKEKEEKKKAEELNAFIKKWEKETGCDIEKSVLVYDEVYRTHQQTDEGLMVIVDEQYRMTAADNNWPLTFFVVKNRIDKHFVDGEKWLGGVFQDTGIDMKYRNKEGSLKRTRKFKRCIDSDTMKRFKQMGIQ